MHMISRLADFVSGHPRGELPQQTREAISLLLLDLMGATAAGLMGPLAASARKAAADIYGAGNAQVWLTETRLSVAGAAMANSAAASALDIDDGHRGAAGHAGAGVIPTALAVAQSIGASDGEILDAIALGYDVALRVAASRPTRTIETYASGRWVSYGAAAAAGRLLRLNSSQQAHALAIAGAEGPIVFPTGSSKFQGSTVGEAFPSRRRGIDRCLSCPSRRQGRSICDDAALSPRCCGRASSAGAGSLSQALCLLRAAAIDRHSDAAANGREIQASDRDLSAGAASGQACRARSRGGNTASILAARSPRCADERHCSRSIRTPSRTRRYWHFRARLSSTSRAILPRPFRWARQPVS